MKIRMDGKLLLDALPPASLTPALKLLLRCVQGCRHSRVVLPRKQAKHSLRKSNSVATTSKKRGFLSVSCHN